MQVQSIHNQQNKNSFQAKISPYFEKFMRNYINNGANRVRKNYKLSQKLLEYGTFGYDDYTINLTTKYVTWGNEYALIATKNDEKIKDGILLFKRNSVKEIINIFLYMNKSTFNNRMQKHRTNK